MSVSQITLILAAASCAAAAAIIVAFAVRRARASKNGGPKPRLGAASIVALVLAVVVAGVNVAVYQFNNIIGQALSTANVDEASAESATAAARDMTETIESEGAVLLKNEGSALPLGEGAKVNVFGIASEKLVYGGSGSGASDETNNVGLAEGLANAGIEVNEDLRAFYQENMPEESTTNIFSLSGGDYRILEPSVDSYGDDLIEGAKSFSDTAIYVISRSGGEGGDLPLDMSSTEGGDEGKHYLELQDSELAILQMVEENFENVIVLVNSSNAMELGFVDDDAVDAALWIGGPGSTGMNAIGKIISGAVNPSGRLTDVYAYDVLSSPASYNCGDFDYTSAGEKTGYHYVDYVEGIYVGYRYYETAAEDGFLDYDSAVQYPFGYGLSYSSFEQKLVSHEESDGTITVSVEVTNTGDVAGKEVVQLYYSAPYTKGGIEKSAVDLAAFSKTKLLEPGESQTVELSFSVEDMASFDYVDAGCYVLEAGDYTVSLRADSHDVIDSFAYTVDETLTYGEGNARSTDEVAATTLFADAAGDLVYVSRADWAGTMPTSRVATKEASEELLYLLDSENIDEIYCSDDPSDVEVTTGADNGLTLADLAGVDFDDPRWDSLVEQMSVDEMANLIGYGGFATVAVDSVDKSATVDIDGPAGLNSLTTGLTGNQYTSAVVIASTYNVELIEEMGGVYASEASAYGVNSVYAPACNTHRTPFSGRNFEYYSEDPLLSGKIGAAEVKGLRSGGIVTYVKHFALNDQETNRHGIAVWANEQAIRQIYLRPFEIMVKEGGTVAIMSSYNRIGAVWAGGNEALLTGVLRNEWGFDGMVISDYDNGGHMSTDQALRAGGDLMLSTLGHVPGEVTTGSDYGISLMQRASKHILYAFANGGTPTGTSDSGLPLWTIALAVGDAVLLALMGWLALKPAKKSKAKKA